MALSLRHKILTRLTDAQENFEQISGKFGQITSADITDGTITSADVADGTLGIADLATGIVLQLAVTGTARKIAFGKVTGTFSGSAFFSADQTAAHGLGVTPLGIGWAVRPNVTGSTNVIVPYIAAAPDATNLKINAQTRDGAAVTGTADVYWMAVG